jgi:signal transduction histidine kinase
LNSILGFTDVILEGLDGAAYMDNDLPHPEERAASIASYQRRTGWQRSIGRMNLHPETFKVQSILEEVASITSTLASEKNLSLFIDEGSDQEIEIYADNTRLRQVMINLVNNSIKFTERGKISLCARPMDGARVLISVTDSGIGIPQDKLEAVFQEFAQVDTSTTPSWRHGTGTSDQSPSR